MSFGRFADILTAVSATVLVSPPVGVSLHSQILHSGEDQLQPYVDVAILGDGVRGFVREMYKHKHIFEEVDSQSGRTAPSETEMIDALNKVDAATEWLELVVGMCQAGTRLFHYAQSFQDMMYFFTNDPIAVAQAVPPYQPEPVRLAEAVRSTAGSARAKPRLQTGLSEALVHKNEVNAACAQTATTLHGRNFANLDDRREEQSRSPPRNSCRSRSVSSERPPVQITLQDVRRVPFAFSIRSLNVQQLKRGRSV